MAPCVSWALHAARDSKHPVQEVRVFPSRNICMSINCSLTACTFLSFYQDWKFLRGGLAYPPPSWETLGSVFMFPFLSLFQIQSQVVYQALPIKEPRFTGIYYWRWEQRRQNKRNPLLLIFKKETWGTAEMGWPLRAHTALTLDANVVPSTHLDGSQLPVTPLRGILCPLLVSIGTALMCINPHTDAHIGTFWRI